MNFRKIIIVLLSTMFLVSEAISRSFDDDPFEFASFIHSLIETTNGLKNEAICSFGDDEISKILSTQIKNFIRLPGGKTNKYSSCKAIYVANGQERNFRSEIDEINREKILTIASFDGFIEMGGTIQVQVGRRNFELILNSKEVKEFGVKLSALAVSLVIN